MKSTSSQQVNQDDVKKAEQYCNQGITYYNEGKHDKAIECFNQAIKFDPSYPNAYKFKGSTLSALGKKSGAIACYDKVISLTPNDAIIYSAKGTVFSALDKQSEAIVYFDKAIYLNPNLAQAYYNKGSALYHLNKMSEAIICFDKAIYLNPNYVTAYNGKGTTLAELDKKEDAIKCFDKAISLNPDDALYYCNKGKALNYLGKEAEALACFNKAYNISKTGNLGSNLSQGNINYINNILSKDRENLLKKITELQKVTTEVSSTVNKLDHNSPTFKKAIEQLKYFTKQKIELTGKAIDSLGTSKAGKNTANHDSSLVLLQKMDEMQAQMQQFYVNLTQGQASINNNMHIGFTLVKEEQIKQTSELTKYGKQLEVNNEAIKFMSQATIDMKAKIASDSKASDKDKQIMESKINAIADKMQNLAKQEDIQTITKEMTKLMSEARITKGRLADLEDDIDNIIEKTESLTVNVVSGIEYDNPLLNNEKLLQTVTKHFSIDMYKALDLSECLESTLMKQIIHDNDSELFLAGILSLNFNIEDINTSNC